MSDENKDIMKQGFGYEEEDVEVLEDKVNTPSRKKLIIAGFTIGAIVFTVLGGIYIKGMLSDRQEEIPVVEEPVRMFDYTYPDIEALRSYGYTGDEIEAFMEADIDPQLMIDEAKELMRKRVEETYIEMSKEVQDGSSPQFQELKELTWLSGVARKIDYTTDTKIRYSTETVKYNASYVKIPPRGNQLFLRVTLEDGSYLFYSVHPNKYALLKDKGNIVIKYDVVEFQGEKFINNITEIEI